MTTSNRLPLLSLPAVRRHWPRWLVALVAVLVLHFVAGIWVIHATGPSLFDKPDVQVPVQVALLKPQAVRDVADAHAAANPSYAGNAGGANAPARRDAIQASLNEPPRARLEASKPETTATARDSDSANLRAKHNAQTKRPDPTQTPHRSDSNPTHTKGQSHARSVSTATASAPGPSPGDAVASAADASSATASSPDALAASATSASAALATSVADNSTNTDASAASSTHASAAVTSMAAASSPATASPAPSATGGALADSNAGSSAHADHVGPGVSAHAANAPKGEKFSLPPPSDLHYESFYNGVQNPSGTIHWATDGSTYQMIVSIPLPFVGTYSYTSEGRIDSFGLAPLRYTEQHGRRGTDVTTFVRDDSASKPHASFTRTPAIVELPAGAQDRFSMFMQLSSLVRGDPARYTAGVTREFFVLDNDSGETWPIETIGDESVHTNVGFVPARHFTRLPRRDGDRRKVDVWLAPSLGWLPIRFMQTEPDGTQIELRYAGSGSLRVARPGSAQANPTDDSRAPLDNNHQDNESDPLNRSHVNP
jgi:Protein of unknown function (DUF3108)